MRMPGTRGVLFDYGRTLVTFDYPTEELLRVMHEFRPRIASALGVEPPQAEAIMEEDPPLLPVAWEKINDVWYNYVKGHNPHDYFGIFDVVRFDTVWLDKA